MSELKMYRVTTVDKDRVRVRLPFWNRRWIKHLLELERENGNTFTVTYIGPTKEDILLFNLPIVGAGKKAIEEALTSNELNRVAGLVVSELTIPQRMLEVTVTAVNEARLRLKEMSFAEL